MKLAERLALQVEDLILAEGLVCGALLGSEADLVTRFGTSRWSLREALVMLEREGRIAIRRGRNGGIFVAEPGLDAVILTLWSYFEFTAVSDREVLDARAIMDRVVLSLAERRIELADVDQLRANLDTDSDDDDHEGGNRQFEMMLEAARNPLAAVLVKAIGQLGLNAVLRSSLSDAELERTMGETRKSRRAQIEAVMAGDLSWAMKLEARTLYQTRRLLESALDPAPASVAKNRERAIRLLSHTRRYKRPELLMHEIASDIVSQGGATGARLGGEAELLARYNVSRTVFREAVRALEHNGIVEMRAGRHSGLFAVAPDPSRTQSAVHSRLAPLCAAPGAVAEVLAPVLAGAAALADPAQLRVLVGDSFLQLSVEVANASGNRILAMFAQLLARLLPDHALPGLAAHLGALDAACAAGDRPLIARVMINSLRNL